MSDGPAKISFIDESLRSAEPGFQDEEEIQILEEEDEAQFLEPLPGKPNKNAVPKWIFMAGGGIILLALIGGGMMAMSMLKRSSSHDQIVQAPQPPVAQPIIQSSPEQGGESVTQGPVGNVAMDRAQQQAPAMEAPQPRFEQKTQSWPAARPQLSAPQQEQPSPAAAAHTPPSGSPDAARIAALEDRMSKLLTVLDGVTKRMDAENTKLMKLETEMEALRSGKSVAVRHPAPVRVIQPRNQTPVRRIIRRAEPQKVHPAPSLSRAQEVKPVQGSQGVIVSSSVPDKVQGWSISSIIGSRAWLIKRNSDGSETEQSVAPGEKLEGKLVTSVDGASKSIMLEGGQRIGVDR